MKWCARRLFQCVPYYTQSAAEREEQKVKEENICFVYVRDRTVRVRLCSAEYLANMSLFNKLELSVSTIPIGTTKKNCYVCAAMRCQMFTFARCLSTWHKTQLMIHFLCFFPLACVSYDFCCAPHLFVLCSQSHQRTTRNYEHWMSKFFGEVLTIDLKKCLMMMRVLRLKREHSVCVCARARHTERNQPVHSAHIACIQTHTQPLLFLSLRRKRIIPLVSESPHTNCYAYDCFTFIVLLWFLWVLFFAFIYFYHTFYPALGPINIFCYYILCLFSVHTFCVNISKWI